MKSTSNLVGPLLGMQGCIVIMIDKSKTIVSKTSADMTHESTSAPVEFLCFVLWFQESPACAGSNLLAKRQIAVLRIRTIGTGAEEVQICCAIVCGVWQI